MKIEFLCEPHLMDAIPHPVPAAKAIPSYYKNIPPTVPGEPESNTAKRCVPFLDAMSAGFIIPLWVDMMVVAKDSELKIIFPDGFQQPTLLEKHSSRQIPDHPLSGLPFGNRPLKLISPWLVKTQPGVSCLFTSPLNHLDPRIKLFDGVVDTDRYYLNVNFPMIFTVGEGEYFFPKGTPIAQAIPFRRETAKLSVGVVDTAKKNSTIAMIKTTLAFGYKDNYWHKGKNTKKSKGWLRGLFEKD